jgi:exopolysaccharide biosynthesis polyprenyl glycosylphosphotransferase
MLPKSYIREVWNKAVMPFLDFFTILGAAYFTYQLRYEWRINIFTDSEIFSKTRVTNFHDYILFAIMFSVISIMYFASHGIYQIKKRVTLLHEVYVLSLGVLVVMGWLIVFLFFNEYNNQIFVYNTIRLSRFLALFGTLFVIIALIVQRLLVRAINYILSKTGIIQNNVIIIGDHPEIVSQNLVDLPQYEVIKSFIEVDTSTFNYLEDLIKHDKVQEIYLNSRVDNCKAIILLCERFKVSTQIYDADLYLLRDISLRPNYLFNNLYFQLRYSALEGWGIVFKRVFDVIFSLTFIITFSWLYLIIILAIYLEDKGNPFYLSQRIGPDGKEFGVYKFRRLKMKYCTTDSNPAALRFEQELINKKDMRNDGVLYKIQDDPRATKVGTFLEKSSLDEIPQFFNVLMGNLSVVGPRPHQPREVEKYKPHHYKVLNIKPGITGLAQINGRSDLTFDQEVIFDSQYVNNWSFGLDIRIIFITPFKLIKGHKN